MSCVEFLQKGSSELGLDLSAEQLDSLCRYYQELAKWSKKMNLVAKASMQETLASHFIDSLTLLPHLPSSDFSMMDVGTGAGFPGLVLKVVCSHIRLTLVEPRAKRVTFLRHIIRTLDLKDVRIVAERLESEDHGQRERVGLFDVVTSRAVAQLDDFLPLAEFYCGDAGQVICMKGPKGQEEYQLWRDRYPKSEMCLIKTPSYTLPAGDKTRQLMIFTQAAQAS